MILITITNNLKFDLIFYYQITLKIKERVISFSDSNNSIKCYSWLQNNNFISYNFHVVTYLFFFQCTEFT
jgi:hypothetical protein